MADRPKKKQTHGVRNDERANGKAPKKRPKLPKTLSPEQRAERDRLAAERRIALKAKADKEAREVARRKLHALARMQGEAIQINAAIRHLVAADSLPRLANGRASKKFRIGLDSAIAAHLSSLVRGYRWAKPAHRGTTTRHTGDTEPWQIAEAAPRPTPAPPPRHPPRGPHRPRRLP